MVAGKAERDEPRTDATSASGDAAAASTAGAVAGTSATGAAADGSGAGPTRHEPAARQAAAPPLGEPACTVRALRAGDWEQWLPLWRGYNAFYGREGPSALPDAITQTTWHRFFNDDEPVFALVAERAGALLGLTHFLYHRSTTRIEPVCYLQDLFTAPAARGRGVGRALIEGVCAAARAAGCRRVYWQTHQHNEAGRRLYDQVAQHHGFIVYSRESSR